MQQSGNVLVSNLGGLAKAIGGTNLLPGTSSILDGIVRLHLNQFTVVVYRIGITSDGGQLWGRRPNSAHLATMDAGHGASPLLQVAIWSLGSEEVAFTERRLGFLVEPGHFE